MHQEIKVDSDYTFTWDFYDKDLELIPTSGTISIYNNGGTAIISAVAVAVGSSGQISYTFATADNDTEGQNFKIELTYIVSGVSYVKFYLFDVVKTPLVNEVSDRDLFEYIPELRNKVKEKTDKTSAAGTTNTMTVLNLVKDNIDYKGGYASIYYVDSTTNATTVHEVQITEYNTSTGLMTFTPAYSAVIPVNTAVRIRPSFYQYIENSFDNHVIRDIRNKVQPYDTSADNVGTASQYINNTVVRNMTIFHTLYFYCMSQVETSDDKWDIRTVRFKELYDAELVKLSEPYDRNKDGNISATENQNRPNFRSIRLKR